MMAQAYRFSGAECERVSQGAEGGKDDCGHGSVRDDRIPPCGRGRCAAAVWIRKSGGYKRMESIVYYDKGTKEYPERMMPFSDMPEGIYVKGRLPRDDRPSAAIVGGRVCSAYGREQARRFAKRCGVRRPDHQRPGQRNRCGRPMRERWKGEGQPLLCWDGGVNICYPRENYPLMRKILGQKGGVLSEFPPGDTASGLAFSPEKPADQRSG